MLMPDPCGVLRNSSISLVSTGRGVEYATRFSVTSFELLSAAVAAPATAVTRAINSSENQTNLLRCIALLESLARAEGAQPQRTPSPFPIGKV